MHKAAVVGSQKQLTRCFRELEVASHKHQKVTKLKKWFIHASGPAPWLEKMDFNKRSLLFSQIVWIINLAHPERAYTEHHDPVRGGKLLGTKNGKKKDQKPWVLANPFL